MDFEELKKQLKDIKEAFDKGMISKSSFDEKMTEINAQILSILAKIQALDEDLRKRATAMEGLQDEKEKFSLGRAISGLFTKTWFDNKGEVCREENSFEAKIMHEFQDKIGKTAMSTTGGFMGYSIPPQAIMDFIEKLYAETVMMKAGARILTGLGSPISIQRQSGSATGYWVAEAAAITESNLTDEQITMTPKEVAALVTVNNKLLALAGSNPSVENMIVNDLRMQIALAIDLAGLRGLGTSNQPRGIANQSSINTYAIGTDGGTFNFDSAIDMEGMLEDDNALRGKLAYITNPKIKRKLKKTKVAQYSGDTGGQYIMMPMTNDNLKNSLGYDMFTTTQIPTNLEKGASGAVCSEVYFGNFDDFILAQWGGLDLATSIHAGDSFKQNQTQIRAIQMVDMTIRHPESFCLCNDAITT